MGRGTADTRPQKCADVDDLPVAACNSLVAPKLGSHRPKSAAYPIGNSEYVRSHPETTAAQMHDALGGTRQQNWINLGGQLVPAEDVDALREDIRSGRLRCWREIHEVYDRWWEAYPLAKQRHAFATLLTVLEADRLTTSLWTAALDEGLRIQEYVCNQVYRTLKKDYENPFRQATFRNAAEMTAVLGTAEDDRFVRQVAQETQEFRQFGDSVRPK